MDIVKIIGLGFIVTLLVLVIRRQHPELAMQLSLVLGIVIFLSLLDKLAAIVTVFENLAAKANVGTAYLNILLKVIGIAYITEFGAQVCRDAGEGAVASKLEIAGKVMIMVMAMPVIALVLDTVTRLIP